MNKASLRLLAFILFLTFIASCQSEKEIVAPLPSTAFNLKFPELAKTWDEAIPLGNGMLGTLVWERDKRLRFSLDRADLWDLRPMENLNTPEYSYDWVKEQWENKTYSKVQQMFDVPYDANPAPSKIPGAALEFDISALGEVESAELLLADALCVVKWKNGAKLETFVNAGKESGWFRFTGTEQELKPDLIAPSYNLPGKSGEDSPVTGQDLRRLGYPAGEIQNKGNSVTYDQKGWGGFSYRVNVQWRSENGLTEGCWSISSEYPGQENKSDAEEMTGSSMKSGFKADFLSHQNWWKTYWSKSSVTVPDTILNKQWYLELYKLGAATGNGAPPVSLQAVWTADNGKLPPWKGDFHNDLNTQLSYWPAYSSNHLEQERGYIDWMLKNRREFEKYTSEYYNAPGINVPGVATFRGQPMGGWIQYAFGPTVSAWLGHHFYLRWRYTMDRDFLEKEAYPWIRDVAVFLDAISVRDSSGLRKLPLSASPEIYNNSREAWFSETTNFDLALIRWTFEKASELAAELGKKEDAVRWNNILSEWPDYDIDETTGFTYARGFPYNESHRHFSHLMAFHPLGIVDWSNGEADRKIIRSTIETLDKVGPDYWCGYSWAWLGNIKARAFDGDGAAEALRIFAEAFCLKNSFHVNGDQSGTGKSKMTYRPFTLEGNFAFASGIQEMLIQSHAGIVNIFPAIPARWENAAFTDLRTEGAFLFSAKMEKGRVRELNITSEKGGELKLGNPFKINTFKCSTPYIINNDVIIISTIPGQKIRIIN